MNDTLPERNPITHQDHRREVFWQITFPLIIGAILIVGLAVWTAIAAAQGGNVSQPADASLVFLLIPTLAMALILLVIIAGFAYAVIWLNKNIPPYARQAQDFFASARDIVRKGSDKVVEPVLRIQSALAALRALRRKT
ncbi:MAG: hypothetical protein KJ638_02175 [Chloroflexi bacterium]|nr:hypothetical protein [Chloroflexota bacterium]